MAENPESSHTLDLLNELQIKLDQAGNENELLTEALSDAVRSMLAAEDIGWNIWQGAIQTEGFSLDELKNIGKQCKEYSITNPLLVNGHAVRATYMFDNGYSVVADPDKPDVAPRFQKIIDDKRNQDAVFSVEALVTNEKSRYAEGQIMVIWDSTLKQFYRFPLDQLAGTLTDPDDLERTMFHKREWERPVLNVSNGTTQTESVKEWYPTDTWVNMPQSAKSKMSPQTINGDKVDYSKVVVDDYVNRPVGATYGVPDVFAAVPWALGYSAYLKDGQKVLSAMADWVWKVSPKSRRGGQAVGESVRSSNHQAGGTIISDMDVSLLPRANAINLATGKPLASQVAASLGISVVTLMADPGESGAYGVAQTLTDPSLRTFKARQGTVGSFLVRCLRLIGLKAPQINWAPIESDAEYRQQQTLAAAWGTGLFDADEIRNPLAKVAHIQLIHPTAPDGVMLPNNKNSVDRTDVDPEIRVSTTTTTTNQGTGSTATSTQKPDGSNSMSTGQGSGVNTNKPSYGNNDLRGTGGRAS